MRIFLLTMFFIVLATQVVQAQPIEVKWYQIVDGKEIPVDFITPNVPYKVVIKVYSPDYRVITVEIRADVVNWFDYTIASKTVELKPGENTIVVDFIFKHKSVFDFGEEPYKGIRGIFVKVGGLYDVIDVNERFLSGSEIRLTSYYWVGLRLYVNGVEYYTDEGAPVKEGDKIKIDGYLCKDGEPAPNVKIKIRYWWDEEYYTYTDSKGYFEHSTTFKPDGLKCPYDHGTLFRLAYIAAFVDGEEVAYAEVDATFTCPETPTPTPTPSPTPIPEIPKAEVSVIEIVAWASAFAIGGYALVTLLTRMFKFK